MSEIEFLTLYSDDSKNYLVVYAGAAPGTHIKYLHDLFPHLSFYLVDPAPFTVKPNSRITIHQTLFTDKLAKQLFKMSQQKGQTILFVSDIRTADPDLLSSKEVEAAVKEDMQKQMDWTQLLSAERAMLKFRLPWDAGTTNYLDGDIYLPVWGPTATTEARLVTRAPLAEDPSGKRIYAMRDYDNKQYEEQMFYFNTIIRPALYPHDVVGEGLDHCYDCRSEVDILTNYLNKYPSSTTTVAAMSKAISRKIASNRTLATGNLDKEDRKKKIRKSQWINGKPAYE
jgi:hypothetical protein